MFFRKPIIHYVVETIIFCVIIFLVSNCKNAEDDSDTPKTIQVTKFRGQRIFPVRGAVFGSGIKTNNSLYKRISIIRDLPDFQFLKIRRAYIQRVDVVDRMRFSYTIMVRNTSKKHAFCGVKSTGLKFLNSDYDTIYTDAINSKAYSSIGLSNSTDWEKCISPQRWGYIVGTVETLALDPFDKVQFVELGLSYSSDSVINSGAKVQAAGYDVSGDWMNIRTKNNGYDTAYVWPYTSIVLIVNKWGGVMQWDYLNMNLKLPTVIETTIDASFDDLPVLKSKISFDGTSDRAIFLFTFSTSSIFPF